MVMRLQKSGTEQTEVGGKVLVGAGITLSQNATSGLPQIDVVSSSITVKEEDGTPSALFDTIEFATGFTVTQNGSTAEVDYNYSLPSDIAYLDTVNTGYMGLQRNNGTDIAFYALVSGDSYSRFRLLADGTLKWGGGTAVPDINLYRASSTRLKTDDDFEATNIYGTIVYKTSTRKAKKDIRPLQENIGFYIDKLVPTEFSYIKSGASDIGFIAEDSPEIFRSADGDSLVYDRITTALVVRVQQQERRIQNLEAQING